MNSRSQPEKSSCISPAYSSSSLYDNWLSYKCLHISGFSVTGDYWPSITGKAVTTPTKNDVLLHSGQILTPW